MLDTKKAIRYLGTRLNYSGARHTKDLVDRTIKLLPLTVSVPGELATVEEGKRGLLAMQT